MIAQNGESSRDPLLSVTNRKALASGGGGGKVSTLTGYLLTDGLNCLTVKYLADWHLE